MQAAKLLFIIAPSDSYPKGFAVAGSNPALAAWAVNNGLAKEFSIAVSGLQRTPIEGLRRVNKVNGGLFFGKTRSALYIRFCPAGTPYLDTQAGYSQLNSEPIEIQYLPS